MLDRISRFKEEWDYTGTKFEDMVQDMTSQLQVGSGRELLS